MDNQPEGRRVKCEGRFGSIREFLYEQVIPVVMEGRTLVASKDLQDMWDLSEEDLIRIDDSRDRYFHNRNDSPRKQPINNYLSLVPLIGQGLQMDAELVARYIEAMGCEHKVAEKLRTMASHPSNFLRDVLKRESKEIHFPGDGNLRGYRISGNIGIGSICQGGTRGGGIRSDAPFLLEVYSEPETGQLRGESNLAGVIGFWPQDNSMLVAQMQSCKNARYPESMQFGVASLHVAESVARMIGFEKVRAYSARNHPQFKSHPTSRAQLTPDFECIWDSSAHKLGFVGSSTENYFKDLTNGTK